MPAGQSASQPNPPLTVFPGRGRHVPAPAGGASGLSFCGVLPLSLLSSFVSPCWFPGSCLEAGGAQLPLRPSDGLARVVEPHLLVGVRFLPTRQGGTKSTGRRPKNRATLQVSPVSMWYAARYCRIYFLDVLGLRFLAPPAVTSTRGLNSDLSQSRASFKVPVTSRASVEVHFVDLESSVRRPLSRPVLFPVSAVQCNT